MPIPIICLDDELRHLVEDTSPYDAQIRVGSPNGQKTLQDTVNMGTIEGASNLIVLGEHGSCPGKRKIGK